MVSTSFRVWSILTLLICVPTTVNADAVRLWTYERLFRESNLVVIGEAEKSQASKDTFPDKNPWGVRIEGIVTVFKVKLILKGSESAQEIRLLHFKGGVLWISNTPTFVKFATGPVELSSKTGGLRQKPNYLLFLKKMGDGRYEPITGQTDPAFSVQEMFFPALSE